MTTNEKIQKTIEQWAGETITSRRMVGGGSIADAQKIRLKSGREFFLKTGAQDRRMFPKEANGLRELRKSGAIRVPEALLVTDELLLLEFIPAARPGGGFFERFGRQFAQLHRLSADSFGFYEDNFIGSTVQLNIPLAGAASDWVKFYWENRLAFQFRLAEKNGFADDEMRKLFQKLENKIDGILLGSEEPPALLHGDLWSGNFLADSQNQPVIIDPAVYYGHREADLAMTKLFGGFDAGFYAAYRECFPLPAGYDYRENIYKLYHVLNHLNLFGRSYYDQAIHLMKFYF